MVNELQNAEILFNPTDIDPSLWRWVNGNVFLAQFDMDPKRVFMDYGVLGGMTAFYLVLSYVLLRFTTKERR